MLTSGVWVADWFVGCAALDLIRRRVILTHSTGESALTALRAPSCFGNAAAHAKGHAMTFRLTHYRPGLAFSYTY
jgi:hypothetical protein